MNFEPERAIEAAIIAGINRNPSIVSSNDIDVIRVDDTSKTRRKTRIEVICVTANDAGWHNEAMIINPAEILISAVTAKASDQDASTVSALMGYIRTFLHSADLASVLSSLGGNGLEVFERSTRVTSMTKIPDKLLNIYQIGLNLAATMR